MPEAELHVMTFSRSELRALSTTENRDSQYSGLMRGPWNRPAADVDIGSLHIATILEDIPQVLPRGFGRQIANKQLLALVAPAAPAAFPTAAIIEGGHHLANAAAAAATTTTAATTAATLTLGLTLALALATAATAALPAHPQGAHPVYSLADGVTDTHARPLLAHENLPPGLGDRAFVSHRWATARPRRRHGWRLSYQLAVVEFPDGLLGLPRGGKLCDTRNRHWSVNASFTRLAQIARFGPVL
jgi:hypothetical protein